MLKNRVVLAGFYPPPFAGEPIHLRQLADFLNAKGMHVEVVNVNRRATPGKEYRSASGRLALFTILVRLLRRSSIFHLHTNGHNWKSWVLILGAGVAARLRGALTILTIHSGLFPGYVKGLGWVRVRMARRALALFTRVVCVNQEIGAAVRGLGIDETRARVIPAFLNGVNISKVIMCLVISSFNF